MQAGTHVKNGTNEEKPMTKYFLQSSLKEGQIFNVDSTFRWVFRQSKNKLGAYTRARKSRDMRGGC